MVDRNQPQSNKDISPNVFMLYQQFRCFGFRAQASACVIRTYGRRCASFDTKHPPSAICCDLDQARLPCCCMVLFRLVYKGAGKANQVGKAKHSTRRAQAINVR